MKTIKQTYTIRAPIESVWKALVDSKDIDGWGGGPATMTGKAGSKFKLWGGDVFGANTKVVKYKKLVQSWYGGKWEKPSQVSFTLTKEKNGTKVVLEHSDMPPKEAKNLDRGWKDYYMGPLKEYVESKSKK